MEQGRGDGERYEGIPDGYIRSPRQARARQYTLGDPGPQRYCGMLGRKGEGMERDWSSLPLRQYRPRPMLKVPVHEVPRAAAPAVDLHNHLGRNREGDFYVHDRGEWRIDDVGAMVALMDECNVAAIVNLDGRWADELEANLDRYDRAYPGRCATFCRLDWDECKNSGWPERLAKSIHDSATRGAAGLKIAKNLGLHVQDENGHLLISDDPRLTPVWEAVAEEHLPVLIHVADPAAFFEQLDEHNERLEELLAHPSWHFADKRFPPMQRLLDGLEGVVSAQPQVTFIGAHVGCYAEDLTWVGGMLDRYPNFNVDIGARIAELGRQPRTTRRLVLAHPTRVLFGTDALPSRRTYSTYFRFLETDDEHFSYSNSDPPGSGRWAISGIHLPADVLADVYARNAGRIVPALSQAGPALSA
jgi:predicted TIM-barrel fold metal-dependent hydrolase